MLILDLYPGNAISINDDIVLRLFTIGSKKIRLGFSAPRKHRIMRMEIMEEEDVLRILENSGELSWDGN